MCGIAGVFHFESASRPDKSLLQAMITQVKHRGPDGFGFHISNQIGLAHSRLSIIDIAGGDQPIHNEDKTIWVIFNGEIFNYIELREQLAMHGHQFYTKSDTEVIVHLYEQYGDDFVNQLNGQFAISLWDSKKNRLILARDRVGITPLFYHLDNNRIFFASEIKSILAGMGKSPTLNPDGLDQLMTFWSAVSPVTVFQGVYEVSPGEMLIIENNKITKKRYWDWAFPISPSEYLNSPENDQLDQLRDILINATKIRLRADVPVGAYLSGGLDSTVISSIIHKYSDANLRTFSLQFNDKELDESAHQDEVVNYLKTQHSSIRCSTSDIAENFLATIWHTEQPILRTAPVPMKILSGFVRRNNYKVVLTGEGSDEVLGGYDIFKETKIRKFWAKRPDSSMRPLLLKRLYPYLDLSRNNARKYLEAFFGTDIGLPETDYFSHIPRWTTTAKVKEFFSTDFKLRLSDNAISNMVASLPNNISQWHIFNRAQYIEAKSLMGGYLLSSQGDRMLMANSVEGRFPFLDHRLIEFANKMHPNLKMKVLNEKYCLKKAMKADVPPGVLARYKQPYRAPDIPAFFTGKSPDYVDHLLSDVNLKNAGYFDASKIQLLLKKIRAGRAIGYKDNMALVGVLSTQAWHDHFITNYQVNFTDKSVNTFK